MSSTITTTVTMLDMSVQIGGAVAILLIVLLAKRELALAAGARLASFARNPAISIAALLVTFCIVVAGRLLMPR